MKNTLVPVAPASLRRLMGGSVSRSTLSNVIDELEEDPSRGDAPITLEELNAQLDGTVEYEPVWKQGGSDDTPLPRPGLIDDDRFAGADRVLAGHTMSRFDVARVFASLPFAARTAVSSSSADDVGADPTMKDHDLTSSLPPTASEARKVVADVFESLERAVPNPWRSELSRHSPLENISTPLHLHVPELSLRLALRAGNTEQDASKLGDPPSPYIFIAIFAVSTFFLYFVCIYIYIYIYIFHFTLLPQLITETHHYYQFLLYSLVTVDRQEARLSITTCDLRVLSFTMAKMLVGGSLVVLLRHLQAMLDEMRGLTVVETSIWATV